MSSSKNAIEDVYRRRHGAFCRAIACLTGSYESAHDVVQEAFARALARRDQFRGDGPLEAWIWRIAIRTAFEHSSRPRTVPLEHTVDPSIVEPDRDPELAAAIRKLPPKRRLVVFLRYLGDLSYGEIASVCGVSEGTVAATLSQARTALAEELGLISEVNPARQGGFTRP